MSRRSTAITAALTLAVLALTLPAGAVAARAPAMTRFAAAAGAGAGGRVVIALALPRQSAMDAYVAGLYRRGSADFHRFLSPAAFARRFGPRAGEIAAVRARLGALGMSGVQVSPGALYLTVGAPRGRQPRLVSRLAAALGGLVEAVIPPAQQPILSPGVIVPATRSRSTMPPRTSSRTSRTSARAPRARTAIRQGVDGGATPCAAAAAAGGYTAPQLASAYDFNGLYARGLHGEGVSAAVLEFGGFHSGNITAFSRCYGLHVPVNREFVDGGSGTTANGSETEVALDIEVLLEMAPGLAHLDVIEAPNDGSGELAAYSAFVRADRASVLSVSWGECEQGGSQSYERLLGAITEQAAAQGQQIFVAAGDSGSKGCSGQPLPTGASISADTEAALPWVTGVGGTDLSEATAQAGATVHREDVWNDGLGAGGGGESVVWAMPDWQAGYLAASADRPAGMSNDCGAPAGSFCRMVPDIALDADAEEGGADPGYWRVPSGPVPAQFSSVGDRGSPGYTILCASADCSAGGTGWGRVGGTSAATPLAAAAAVLWDQEAREAGLALGFLNPSLYGVAADPASYSRDFWDVTGGTNNDSFSQLSCVAGCAKLYGAGPGYDMASGLGAVNVAQLGPDLLRSASGGIALTPSFEQMYGNTGHGASTTAPVSITGAANPWSATSDATWLTVAASGTTPGRLRWHVDPAGLAPGTYHGTISVFTAGAQARLAVTYTVSPPARIGVLTRVLHFSERALRPAGASGVSVCGTPLWGDELEYRGTLPGLSGVSFLGDLAASARRVLRIVNRGAPGSVLHVSIDQTGVAWISNDPDPSGHPRRVQLRPGQPLVPSQVSLRRGRTAAIHLASLANSNAVGGLPALQQGTYHGTIVLSDLADPRDRVRVPVTLKLADGRASPRMATNRRSVTLTMAPGTSRRFSLTLSDPGGHCGYAYSLSSSRSWLGPAPSRHAGTVHAHHVLGESFRVTVPPGTPAGDLHARIQIASVNAVNPSLGVPVTVHVR